LGFLRLGAGATGAFAGPDAGYAAQCAARAAAVAAAGHAGAQSAGCSGRSAHRWTQTRRLVAGIVDPAALHPGSDSWQRGAAGGSPGAARGGTSALAIEPDRPGYYSDAFRDSGRPQNKRWRMMIGMMASSRSSARFVAGRRNPLKSDRCVMA